MRLNMGSSDIGVVGMGPSFSLQSVTQAPSPLNLHISRGGIYRKKSDVPKPRLTQAEREIRTLQLAEAMKLANDGDDAMLRMMTDIRFAVECVVDAGGIMTV